MKKALFIILAIAAAITAYAQKSRIVTDTIHSKILNAPRAYSVYLPPSFDSQPERQYPILYLLHGMWGKNDDWFTVGEVSRVADQMIRSGQIEDMIIITPDAGGGDPKMFQNGYINMPGWRYEDFFIQEFMPQIEKKYRVKQDRGQRGISGLSMGGGGCTFYAQHYPDLFSAVYAMSALMEIPETGAVSTNNPDDKMAKLTKSVIDNSCVKFVTDSDDARKDKLRSISWYVDCGDDDFLLDRNIDFYRAMRAAGIPCEMRVRDGIHDWEYWHTALYECLPFMQRNFYRHQK